MRVVLFALAFSMISFVAGIAGDLSVVAQAAQQPARYSVVVPIPPDTFIATPTARAATLKAEPAPVELAAPPKLQSVKIRLKPASGEADKAPRKI